MVSVAVVAIAITVALRVAGLVRVWRIGSFCCLQLATGKVDTRLAFGMRQWWLIRAHGSTVARQRRWMLTRCDTRERGTRAVGEVTDIVANSERRVENDTIILMVYIR